MLTQRSLGSAFVMFGLSVALCHAQQSHDSRFRFASESPGVAQRAEAAATGEVNLTATSANVKESGNAVKIRLVRWSTEEERAPVFAALNPPPPAVAQSVVAPGSSGGAGSGSPSASALPAGAGPSSSPAAAGRGRGGRGGAGRGGRGGPGTPLNPIAALTAAIGKGTTVGYIWTNGVTGYAIKYAYRASLPGGGERIILATDRRLGAFAPAWRPVVDAPLTDYEFTLIDIRLDSKGLGEGKTSLTTKVIADNEARIVALDDYAGAPVILQNVKR
jgi:hypothetical protein